ncbi:MAG: hypothetical protein MH204_10265 [Fimbriimonadaceae bacterium]|nr:hypothetical protein [Fimbriimonadaceae bacterium]
MAWQGSTFTSVGRLTFEGSDERFFPADAHGFWNGSRCVGLWSSADRKHGGRFEIWSEEVRNTLSRRVHRRLPGAPDMTPEAYAAYRDQGVLTLEDETGEWVGDYEDRSGGGREVLHLRFDFGVIRGRGHDKDGDFVILGSYHSHTNSVHWFKVYIFPVRLFEYRGLWNKGHLTGQWAMVEDPDYNGAFSLAPAVDEIGLKDAVVRHLRPYPVKD